MADEIRVAPEGLTTDDPELARAEIAMTRARMSETIDEIEDVLLRRKERIQDRLDLFSPVRERPLQFAGIVFGIGLLLGFLTGGDDDEDDEVLDVEFDFDPELHGSLAAAARADLWESRARRMMAVSRDGGRHLEDDDEWEDDEWDDDEDGSTVEAAAEAFHNLRDTVEERARPLISSLLRRVVPGNRGS
jgi:ElaB/YqjD/DUF883 family membrane-anchored ribosome-binding protein